MFRDTPLIKSDPLSSLVGCPVWLKLDALQPSGSFKDRGMAYLCLALQARGVSKVVSSSGGNAGLACATAAGRLGMSVEVVVPDTTKPMVVARLRSLGAAVTVHGANWNAADVLAREKVANDPDAEYVSPYDDPLLWAGHSSLVDELALGLQTAVPSHLVLSVGGGGLLCGVLEGLARQLNARWARATVVASETEGAASFHGAWHRPGGGTDGGPSTVDPPGGGPDYAFKLAGVASVATSLGALQVTPAALHRATAHPGAVVAQTCTDAEAVAACANFANDHKLLVEPACGAALAVAYSERLRSTALAGATGVVIQVCGGSAVSLELLDMWQKDLGLL